MIPKIGFLLPAGKFFPRYAKGVKNFDHKLVGSDGTGRVVEFTAKDKKLIAAGLRKKVEEEISNLNSNGVK